MPDGVTGDPVILVQPASLDFGSVHVGTAVSLAVKIYNFGLAELRVIRAFTSSADFPVLPEMPGPVDFLGESQLLVEFAPDEPGTSAGTLTIESNDPEHPTVQVALRGIGFQPG